MLIGSAFLPYILTSTILTQSSKSPLLAIIMLFKFVMSSSIENNKFVERATQQLQKLFDGISTGETGVVESWSLLQMRLKRNTRRDLFMC